MIKSPALIAGVALALSVLALPAAGMDTEPTPPPPSGDHAAGQRAIENRDWEGAIRSLTAAEKNQPGSADIQNLLGFAYRNSGQLEPAFRHYERALKLDPRHLGAHEYVGEAYLMTKNLAKAEAHLAALERICPRSCEPRDDLKRKIADYKARNR